MAFLIAINLLGTFLSIYIAVAGTLNREVERVVLGLVLFVVNTGLLIQNATKYFGS